MASTQGTAAATIGEHREETRTVGGVRLQVLSGGRGDPLLVLHDYEYLNEWQPFEAALSASYSVVVPSHPGFGASELPAHFDAIDDLVKITLRSEDVPVSFAIDAYRIVKRVPGKTSITFEFRADQAGTFPFYCNLTTDPGCKEMRGIMTVRAK